MNYLFFDTETSGLPTRYDAPAGPHWPHTVSLSWLLADDENGDSVRHYIIKPNGYTIPEEASAIHGITTERASIEGRDLGEVLAIFESDLRCASIIIAHNLAFDIRVLETAYLHSGLSFQAPEKQVCTMQKTTNLLKLPAKSGRGYKWPKLSELYSFLFHEDFENAHSSDADTLACARCFFQLQKMRVL